MARSRAQREADLHDQVQRSGRKIMRSAAIIRDPNSTEFEREGARGRDDT
jgi:hypothetical protein